MGVCGGVVVVLRECLKLDFDLALSLPLAHLDPNRKDHLTVAPIYKTPQHERRRSGRFSRHAHYLAGYL